MTWRIAGIAILGAITYAFTRDVAQTTGITLFFHALRFALYYCHERLWDRSNWGRLKHPLAEFQTRLDLTSEDRDKIRGFLEDQGYLVRGSRDEIPNVMPVQARRRSACARRS